MFKKQFLVDLLERTVSTFIQAFAASLVVTGLDDWQTALETAAIAGLLAVAKGLAARQVGNPESAGLA